MTTVAAGFGMVRMLGICRRALPWKRWQVARIDGHDMVQNLPNPLMLDPP